jgi:hypothetical protein
VANNFGERVHELKNQIAREVVEEILQTLKRNGLQPTKEMISTLERDIVVYVEVHMM